MSGRLRSVASLPPNKASLAGAAPARPQLRAPGIAFVPHPMPSATLRTTLRPGSGPGFVPQPGPSQPCRQHHQGRGAHRELVLASSSRIVSRVPPVGPGLKWNLFDSRPLFHLTPLPPRRLWPLRTLSQSPSPKAKARTGERCRGRRFGLEVSAGRSIVLARSGAQRGLQGSGSVTRTGPVWLVRDRMPLPPDKAASPKSARRPQAFVVRSHTPSRSPRRQEGLAGGRKAACRGLRRLAPPSSSARQACPRQSPGSFAVGFAGVLKVVRRGFEPFR